VSQWGNDFLDCPIGTIMITQCTRCGRRNRLKAADLAREVRCGACKAQIAPPKAPIEADPVLFDEVVRESPLPILVDFWAAWCGPCRMAAPEVERVAETMAGRAVVLKVNTEAHPEVAARYRVEGIPNFVVLKDGRLVFQQAGVVPAAEMIKWLQAAGAASSADAVR
jgi:thioredoxin 2